MLQAKSDRMGLLSSRTNLIIRDLAVYFAVVYVAYGFAVALGWIAPVAPFSIEAACFFGVLWLAAAWWQYRENVLASDRTSKQLVSFHLLTGAYTVWVTGFDTPFIMLWVLLIAVTGLQFMWRGFWLGYCALIAAGIVTIVQNKPPTDELLLIVAAVIMLGVVSFVVTLVLHYTLKDQREMDHARAQATLQRDRITTLVNNLADAIISTNTNGSITLYNAAVINLLDTNTSLEGQGIDEVLELHDMYGDLFSLADALTDAHAVTVRDDIVMTVADETVRLELTYAPIRNSYNDTVDENVGYVVILRDITKAKSLEEERDEFISVVSHELRTPITIAEGSVSNAQIMLKRTDIPPNRIAKAIDLAHDQIVFLAKMVNDLSTLSRAERGVADEPEDIDVNELIEELYTEHKNEACDKGLALDLKLPSSVGTVHASRLYLKELLQNFLTNAIKYTNEGSVTIDISTAKRRDVVFAIRDTGVGISKADLQHIFEKFYRVEDYRTRESGGTGLGLYVASKLARKLEATIDAKSRLNHGSTFSITLPLAKKTKSKKQSTTTSKTT